MLLRTLCCAIVAALVASPLAAADKNDKNTKNTKNLADKNVEDLQLAGKKGDILPGFKLPKGMALSAEQQEKLKAIKEQVAPKLGELQKQIDAVVTKERRQAQSEAMQRAKAEGKDKKEINRAGQQALGLKDDEAAKLKQLNVERGTILKQVQQQLQALLTAEQQAKLAQLKGKGIDKNKDILPGFNLPKGVELSAEQQEKLKASKEEVAPKLGELQKQIDAVVTKERRQAQAEAMGKAKAEGKNKNEVLRAGQEALALKDDEAAKLKQLNVERGTILKQVRQQLEALLTDEQKAKLAEIKGKGVDKNKNLKPDKGVKSGKGQRADKNLKPGKGAAPDKNTKNVKGASK